MVSVARIIRQDFNPKVNSTKDIAILELGEEVDLTTYTPACLARSEDKETFDGKMAVTLGKEAVEVRFV